ncbi:MAG: Ig-like domain-containing protein [Jatrophihabitans sp.]
MRRSSARSFVARHRAAAATAVICLILSAVVVVFATRSDGNPARHVDLNDGGVWVTDSKDGYFGQLDNPTRQFANVFFTPGGPQQQQTSIDIVQSADIAIAWDQSGGTVYPIDKTLLRPDPAGVSIGGGSELALGGRTAAVLDPKTGSVWAAVLDDTGATPSLDGLSTKGKKPLATVGAAAELAVSQDGTVFVASAATGKLATIHTDGNSMGKAAVTTLGLSTARIQLTAVGDEPVVLDITAGRIVSPGHPSVDVGESLTDPTGSPSASVALQQPGPTAPTVLVASNHDLRAIILTGGAPKVLVDKVSGTPARPVLLDGCTHAAWGARPGTYARTCDGAPVALSQLPEAVENRTASQLVFRVNRDQIVLNDSLSGAVVSLDPLQQTGNWDALLPKVIKQNPKSKKNPQTNENAARTPPKARDDNFGARSGRVNVLHPLDNDSSPSGSVLAIRSVTPSTVNGATVTISPDGQTVELAVPAGGNGPYLFNYTVDDGHGKTSNQAKVSVTLHPVGGPDGRPALRAKSKAVKGAAAAGATVPFQVLSEWRDPDSDPLFLLSASVGGGGTVSTTTDGRVIVTAPSVSGPTKVSYTVADGYGESKQGSLTLNVQNDNSIDATAPKPEWDLVRGSTGAALKIDPLANDEPGSDPSDPSATLKLAGDVQLTNNAADATVSTDQKTGEVTFLAQRAGTYFLTYTEYFGSSQAVKGNIRVDVTDADNSSINAVPDLGVVHGEQPADVDVLANDFDPGGGVMVVQQAVESGQTQDLEIAIIDHRFLRVTPASAGIAEPRTVRYEVTDGVGEPVWGQVSVVQLPPPDHDSLPIAQNDAITVRSGDVTISPVLDNDSDPDGDPLHIVPGSVRVVTDGDSGMASTSGNAVRYAAPSGLTKEKKYNVSYVVADPAGGATTGTLVVTVEPENKRNTPPTPADVESSAVAGDTITIAVPTTGVDPEGDSVTVTGIDSAPKFGRIVGIGANSIRYQAYPNIGQQGLGTDTFTYVVVDRFGATGIGTVRVGVVPPGTPQPPVAVDDSITAAPGAKVTIPVLSNDFVTAGDDFAITLPRSNTDLPPGTSVDKNNRLITTAPTANGKTAQITYELDDGSGRPSYGHVVVRSQAGFDNPPVALDDEATLPKTGDSQTVDVLVNDSDPDGPVSGLKVKAAYGDATVSPDGQSVTVQLTDFPHSVGYLVEDSAATPQGTIGIIHVPGRGSGAPMLRPDVNPIALKKNAKKTINIDDYVVDPAGKPLRLTTKDRIWASPTNGLTVASQGTGQLQLTAGRDYVGPGAITFEVTDGKTLSDGQRAVVTVPVQIGDVVPVIRCPSSTIDVVQGGTPVNLDVATLCHVWTAGDDLSKTTFTASWKNRASGVDITQSGSSNRMLRLTAHGSARPGKTGVIAISAAGAQPAQLHVRVIGAPLPQLDPISRDGLVAGKSTRIDIGPYLSTQIADPSVTVLDASYVSGPAVKVTVSGSSVEVTPAAGSHGTAVYSIDVTDVSGQTKRAVSATLTLGVIGPPDTPGTPTAASPGSRTVQLTFSTPAANGTPITSFVATDQTGHRYACAASGCSIGGLNNGTVYQFRIVAKSAVGDSKPSGLSNNVTPDKVPESPNGLSATPGDTKAASSWQAAVDEGSPIVGYQVQISPAPAGQAGTVSVSASTRTHAFTSLTNGVEYSIRVRARNKKGFGDWSDSVPVTPFGKPATPAAPTVTARDGTGRNEKVIGVQWAASSGNGRPIENYALRTYRNGSVSATKTLAATSTQVSVPNDGSKYYFTVAATNSGKLTSAYSKASATTEASSTPDQMAKPGATATGNLNNGKGSVRVTFTLPNGHGAPISAVYYTVDGGGATRFPSLATTQTIYLPTNGSHTIRVYATNKNGSSPPSAGSAVSPYGQPSKPTAGATNSGTATNPALTFSWGGGSGNGRAVIYQIQIDSGAWTDEGSSGGSVKKTYGNSETHTVHVRIKTSAGTSAADSASAKTDAKPPPPPPVNPTVRPDHGGPSGTTSACPNGSCYYIGFAYTNIKAGTYTFVFYDGHDVALGHYQVSLSAGSGSWHAGPGKVTQAVYGKQTYNQKVRVTIDGPSGHPLDSGWWIWYPSVAPA